MRLATGFFGFSVLMHGHAVSCGFAQSRPLGGEWNVALVAARASRNHAVERLRIARCHDNPARTRRLDHHAADELRLGSRWLARQRGLQNKAMPHARAW